MHNRKIFKLNADTKFVIWILSLIPIFDRIFVMFNDQYITQRLADILVILIASYILIKSRFLIRKDIGVFIILIFGIGILFFIRDSSLLSIRQSISIGLSAIYVYSIVLVMRLSSQQQAYIYFARAIVLISFLNSILIILVGLYPAIFSSVVGEISMSGRTVLDYRLPFVRNAGLFNHYGYYGAFLITSLLMLFFLRTYKIIGIVKGFLIHTALFSAAIVSQSRVVVMVYTSCLLLMILINLGIRLKYLILIGFVTAVFFVNDILSLWDFIVSIKQNSFDSRMDQISMGLNIFSENILLGGGYSEYFKNADGHVLHNMPMTLISSIGLIGMMLFIVVNVTPIFRNHRHPMFAISLVAFVSVHMILMASSGLSFYSFWMFIGLYYAIPNFKKIKA